MKIIVFLLILICLLTGCDKNGDNNGTDINSILPSVSYLGEDIEGIYTVYIHQEDMELGQYEPSDKCYIGANIAQDIFVDGDINTFEELTGTVHDLYSYSVKISEPFPTSELLECYVNEKIPVIIIYPDDYYSPFAETDYEGIAKKYGELDIPMFIQFYPNPTKFTNDSERYKEYFINIREAFKKEAPSATFIWSVPAKDVLESMYYYPGDEYVDWVGINYYESGNDNEVIDNEFWSGFEYLYYSFQKTKPIMVSQLGISHFSTKNHEYSNKSCAVKIGDIYDKLSAYPRLKGIIYMDFSSLETGPKDSIRENYLLSDDSNILNAYTQSVSKDFYTGGGYDQELIRSPFFAYKINGEYYICEKTLVYDMGVVGAFKSVEIDGNRYINTQELIEINVEINEYENKTIILK